MVPNKKTQKTTTPLFFLAMLIAISIAFVYLVLPYSTAIIWGIILSLVLRPIFLKFEQYMPNNRTLATLLTIFLGLFIIVLPLFFVLNALIQELLFIRQQINNGTIDLVAYFETILSSLPVTLQNILAKYNIANIEDIQDKFMAFSSSFNLFIANHIVNIGQNAFSIGVTLCLMLYLLFFLIRDGSQIFEAISGVIPLSDTHKNLLFNKFSTVITATIKGSVTVAIIQGILGGFYFWMIGVRHALFWVFVMSLLSLIPAIGSSIVWLPVAIYLIAVGKFIQGIGLIVYGVFVIAMVDSLLRPKLVGKSTQLPDFIVLITTIGGISLFGVSGFVLGPMIAALFIGCWSMLSDITASTTDPK